MAQQRKPNFHFVTLTLRSGLGAGEVLTPEGMRKNARKIRGFFRELYYDSLATDGKGQKRPGVGATTKVEFGAKGHCHLHAIVVGLRRIPNSAAEKYWLASRWEQITGDSRSVWVDDGVSWARKRGLRKPAVGKVVQEVCKYVSKPGHGGAAGLAPTIAALAAAGLYKQRRWDTYGVLRGVDVSGQENWESCPECNSAKWKQGPWALSGERALDAASVMDWVNKGCRCDVTPHNTS
jgi:hypothetical protein